MEKIRGPVHNLFKKLRIATFTSVIMMHLSIEILGALIVPQEKPIRNESN